MSGRLAMLALMALAAVALLLAAPATAQVDADWLQPVLVESLSAVATEGSSSAAALATAQAEAAHAALLAQTVTTEGKTSAQFRAEVEARADKLFEEFKKAFKRDYGRGKFGLGQSDEEKLRSKIFFDNLLQIGSLNGYFSQGSTPVHLRVVYSHMVETADVSQDEFKQFMLGAKLSESPLARTSFLETGTTIGADADADADVDAEADVDADAEAEAEAEAEVEAEAEAEQSPSLSPSAECVNKWYGRCMSASSCPANKYNSHIPNACGKAVGNIVCCVRNLEPSKPLPPLPPEKTVAYPAGAPKDVDWRSKGTPIKNQGKCKTAWAMAAVSVLESTWNIKSSPAVPALSVQQLADGATSMDAEWQYCQEGKTPYTGLSFLAATQGLYHDSDNPYLGKPGKRPDQRSGPFGIKDRQFKTPNPKPKSVEWVLPQCLYNFPDCKFDETIVGQALNKWGPLAAMIDASQLQFYKSGVIRPDSSQCQQDRMRINHAVVIEGLGTDKATGKRFWIVRNSWGAGWGEGGRMRMEFGVNTCSIASWPIYATV